MPQAALKPCSYPGCPNLVRHGLCPDHLATTPEYHDPEVQKFYNTARWKQIRRVQLSRQPWCEDCLKEDHYVPATDVHHKHRHQGDPTKFFGGPFESLCHSCHSRKTAEEVFRIGP